VHGIRKLQDVGKKRLFALNKGLTLFDISNGLERPPRGAFLFRKFLFLLSHKQ